MANSIERRVAEFLSGYPPFSDMLEDELNTVAHAVHIRYCEGGERIFTEGESTLSKFFVVRKGSVRIFKEDEDQTLVDLCDEGDVFGIRPLLAEDPYLASSETVEETLLYEIPADVGSVIISQNPKVGLYLARGYAAGMPTSRLRREHSLVVSEAHQADQQPDATVIEPPKRLIFGSPEDSIRKVAERMTEHNVGSILIMDDREFPIGIVTDSDLRRKVVSKGTDASLSVESIMSAPVRTLPRGTSYSQAIITMLDHRVQHLCITIDGTPQSKALGVISLRDLMAEKGLNPTSIIKNINRAVNTAEIIALRGRMDALMNRYLQENTATSHVSEMKTVVTNHLVNRLIEIYKTDHPDLPDFTWLALGSMGRKEQLLKTDQDHTIILQNGCDSKEADGIRDLALFVEKGLAQWGIQLDEAGVHASSPTGIKTLAEWKESFQSWVRTPDPTSILNTHIYFDFREVAGNEKMCAELREFIAQQIDPEGPFLLHLAADVLNTASPLSFFRQFVVEKDGAHRDEFDLKRRVLLPLCDSARLLILQHKITHIQNTPARYLELARLEQNHRDLFTDAAKAYEWLIRLRWINGTTHKSSGRFIEISTLSKADRQRLRDIFSTLSEIQQLIKVRFRTEYLGR